MLYVVRHGETDHNAARRICGRAEVRLTEKGYQQTKLVAEKIARQEVQVDRLLASPLKWTQETARKIAGQNQLTIEIEPCLIEMNSDIYDGEPIEATVFQEDRSKTSLPLPEGESVLGVVGRIYPLIEEAPVSEETYLFACRSAVVRVIDNYFNGKRIRDFSDSHYENTQLIQYGE